MVQFSLGQALVGGGLMSAASCLMLYFYGRFISETGFVASSIQRQDSWIHWRLTFLIGMLLSPTLLEWIFNGSVTVNGDTVYFFNGTLGATNNILGWFIGGLLVGIGTRMGCGCLGRHLITGLPLLTKRSIFACLCFIGFGFLMANFKSKFGFLTDDTVTF